MSEQYKVLIVDDESLLRNLIRMSIDWEGNGMTVVGEAGSAQEAFPLVEELTPDIIFTDICMPVMDGIDFARAVMEKHPRIRIAVVTGYDDFVYAQRSIHAGIIGYLLKPIKAAELLEVTARMKSSLALEARIAALLDDQRPSRTLHPLVSRVVTHLEENMADPGLNLNDVAAQCFVSTGHLGRLMKQETGMTFVEYLTNLRIERAKKLLLETDVAAYEVGRQVGVEDAHYFSLVFKKNVGMTISEFRRE